MPPKMGSTLCLGVFCVCFLCVYIHIICDAHRSLRRRCALHAGFILDYPVTLHHSSKQEANNCNDNCTALSALLQLVSQPASQPEASSSTHTNTSMNNWNNTHGTSHLAHPHHTPHIHVTHSHNNKKKPQSEGASRRVYFVD